jgi:hypothetical protein
MLPPLLCAFAGGRLEWPPLPPFPWPRSRLPRPKAPPPRTAPLPTTLANGTRPTEVELLLLLLLFSCLIFEAEHVCINITQSDHVGACGDAGDEWIVVKAETAQQVGDEFFVFKTLANGCKRIAEALDSSVVVGNAEILLLDCGELHANLHNSCLGS